jgi:N-acetylglucosamine-6-phosphate deacetylase
MASISENVRKLNMSQLLIQNVVVVELDRLLVRHSVRCRDGKIEWIGPEEKQQVLSGDQIIDGDGCYLAPGYIDLHIHGLHRYLTDRGSQDLSEISRLLPQYGVTGFLATVCPRPPGEDAPFLASLVPATQKGARILGFHLEGPFLTLTGALPKEALGKADPQRVSDLIEAAKPFKAIFSVAPDFEWIEELIPLMTQGSTPVFMTHTAASVRQTQAAIDAGARHATHFYDVFPVPAETEPGARPCGAVEAILADPRVSVDFILDGEHVDPVAVKMALACKGPDRVCLITDANIGAGLPPGQYEFVGGAAIGFAHEGGPARAVDKSGRLGWLAGSGLTMNRAVINAVDMLDVDLPQAVRMASHNPAKVLGLDQVKGRIHEGYDADMVLLDGSFSVLRTWIKGECCFENKQGCNNQEQMK